MKQEERDKLTAALEEDLLAAQQSEKTDHPLGISPIGLWRFKEIVDEDSPGEMVPPVEVDEEQLQNNTIMCRSLYEEFLVGDADTPPCETPRQALVQVAIAAFGEERPRDAMTVVSHLAEQTAEVMETCRYIALGLQSRFEYAVEGGMLAIYSLHDALELAEKMISMKHAGAPGRESALLKLTMLIPELAIPLSSGSTPLLLAQHCCRRLERIGAALLPFLFSD